MKKILVEYDIRHIWIDTAMSTSDEKEYISRLTKHAEDTVSFLSSKKKSDRERSVCIAFLRCLGISFSIDDVVSVDRDPPDVSFQGANFEIVEDIDEERVRHAEWKDKVEMLKKAETLDEIMEPYKASEPISFSAVTSRITGLLNKKANKYSKGVLKDLDALVYVNLLNRHLDASTKVENINDLIAQGWRSVSMVMPPYGHVYYANESSPDFLLKAQGKTLDNWENLDSLFTLENDPD